MDDEIELILEEAREAMQKSLAYLSEELIKIRAGRATPAMLDSVMVDYYGTPTPLNQTANVNTPDARTITVQPWEKKMIEPIEKAIAYANLGLNPQNNGEQIIITVPPLTEERRRDLVKRARAEAEHAKVGIRNARKAANDELKRLQKEGLSEDRVKVLEQEIQDMTDKAVKRTDDEVERKEKDIMTI
ncbi:MAG TPA: ribosome recycling factor [Cryomorphaceae bacterium]|nr:ribosome recycling factor [Cryomorphaceae bacterium]